MEFDLNMMEDHTNELKALGINVMDQLSLEQNIAVEVDEAVKKQNRKQKQQILRRELKESKLEILKLKNKEDDLKHKLSGMRQRLIDPRQYISVEKSCNENSEQLKAIRVRITYVEEKLNLASEDPSVLDDVDLNLEEGELIDEDEDGGDNIPALDKDTLIKEGKMTPFGTLLNSFDSQEDVLTIRPTSISTHVASESDNKFKAMKKTSTLPDRTKSINHHSTQHEKLHQSGEKKVMSTFEKYLQDQVNKQQSRSKDVLDKKKRSPAVQANYGNFKRKKIKAKEFISEFDNEISQDTKTHEEKKKKSSPLKKTILQPKKHWKEKNLGSATSELESDQYKTPAGILSERVAFITSEDERQGSDSDYVPSEDESLSGEELDHVRQSKSSVVSNVTKTGVTTKTEKKFKRSKRVADDGYIENYAKRIKQWKKERLKEKHNKILAGEDIDSDEDDEYERFDGDYKIPLSIWNKLYKYQRTCVKWLWELHCQQCGGILGDEMGLGKTIMIITFLVGLSYSGLMDRNRRHKGLGPVLIVAPATVLHQWVREFHRWWPAFRVAVLHESGVFRGTKAALIHNINNHDGILITSYRGVVDHLKVLLNYDWHYIILDEGHKIRNPAAQITVAVKRFETAHRLILSGSPIQNGLKELWSLFDFIFPGKLGSLPVFLQQFAVPITQGGYANASKLEVQTAFKCATVLRDTINPYLLRRMKIDVKNHLSLPDKSEQVLFCGLTDDQRVLYRRYLDGNEVKCIMNGRLQVFVGLINLRKICNHPDLYDGGPKHFVNEDISNLPPELLYGWWKRAGKMVVLHSVLQLWKKQDHKVLLFTQSRQMMCILEKFLMDEDYRYLKMDGCTSVGSRQSIIDRFNKDHSIFVFLLTTRVGGLGVNLTGADRVLIYDPDWNPSTDTQARERAWRIGQTKPVTIYRLVTAGTIEEKIYHRQIFKQFLTNRVLKDPKQQRFFKSNDLYELFTLNEGEKEKTESAAIFAGTGSEIIVKSKEKSKEKGSSELGEEKSKSNIAEESKLVKNYVKSSKSEKISKINDLDTSIPTNDSNSDTREKFKRELKNSVRSIDLDCDRSNEAGVIYSGEAESCNEQLLNEGIDIKDKGSTTNENKHLTEEEVNKRSSFGNDVNGASENNNENENFVDINKGLIGEEQPEVVLINGEADDEDRKKERMRALAKLLSRKIVENKNDRNENDEEVFSKRKDKKKHKKDKEKSRKKKRVEGEKIDNLVKKRKYKYSEDRNEDETSLNKAQDDFVLQNLFKKSGVHTALSHDVIVNSGDPDYLLLETEAEKVAKEALKQVRLSRAQCFQTRKNRPDNKSHKKNLPRFGSKRNQLIEVDPKELKKSGSGKSTTKSTPKMFNGCIDDDEEENVPSECAHNSFSDLPTAPVDEGASSGVLSSAQLLKRMRERNRVNTSAGIRIAGNPDGDDVIIDDSNSYDPDYPSTAILEDQNVEIDPEIQEHVDILSDIRNFIAFQAGVDGRASTDEVVQRFKDHVPSNQNHIFRALLNQICDFVRERSGQGFWYIKEEFR